MAEIDLSRPTVLEKKCVYVVPLMEELQLPEDISGDANPRSTVGRLDVFTRLIANYSESFDAVPIGYHGPLYAEIVPNAFTVVVKAGMRLNQIRFARGATPHSDTALSKLDVEEGLVYSEDGPRAASIQSGLRISVSLKPSDRSMIIGYRAKPNAPIIDFGKINHYNPLEFWDIVHETGQGLILNPGEFYILGSKERIRVPPSHSAEMVPFDPSLGEFRIHYAGFFDPGFGYGYDDINGTKAVLEVRSHEVPFLIEDGQIVASLVYGRLIQQPDRLYGNEIGSSYQRQGLSLSKQFRSIL
jgi:dCTP deaminase